MSDPDDVVRHDAVAMAVAARRADEAETAMRLVVRESLDDIHRRLIEPRHRRTHERVCGVLARAWSRLGSRHRR
jgi:hypothetical protein